MNRQVFRRCAFVGSGLAAILAALPAKAATIELQLRADQGVTQSGGRVSAWADQATSGGDDTVTQGTIGNQPFFITSALNGKSALRYDDAQKLIGASATQFDYGTGDFTMVTVMNFTGLQTGTSRMLGNLENGNGFGGLMFDANDAGNKISAVYRPSPVTAVSDPNLYPQNALSVWIAVREGGQASLYKNGALVAGPIAATSTVNGDELTIGAERSGGGEYLSNAEMFEVRMYDGALTTAEVSALNTELATTWAVPEPSSAALAAFGCLGLLRRVRRTVAS